MGDVGQRVQTLNYEINKFWDLMYNMMIIVNVILYSWKLLERNLKCSHQKKEMVIMWQDGGIKVMVVIILQYICV